MIDPMNLSVTMAEYECGGLGEQECIDLFQALLDAGDAFRQPETHYGRETVRLIDAGLVKCRITE
jgi:hypothetical protein